MGDLQILISAILAESSEKAIDSTLKSLVDRLGTAHEIKLKIGIDEKSKGVVQTELQTIAKAATTAARGSSGVLSIFDAAQLKNDGRKYFAETKGVVSKVKTEFSQLGRVDVTNVFKNSKGEIQSFTANVTKADGVIEKFNFTLSQIKDGTKTMKGFVQTSSVLTDKNAGSNLEKTLNYLNRVNDKIADINSRTLKKTNPLLPGMSQFDEYQAKLTSVKTRIDEITSQNKTLSSSHTREIDSMVKDLGRYGEELQKSAYSAFDLKAKTFAQQKEILQSALKLDTEKWESSGLLTDDLKGQIADAKSMLDGAFDSKGLDAYKHKLTLIGHQFKKLKIDDSASGKLLDAKRLETNIKTAQQRILNLRDTYSAFVKDPELLAQWQNLFDKSKVVSTQKELTNLNAEIRNFEQNLIGAGKHQKSFWGQFISNAGKMGAWMILGGVISTAIRGVTGLYDAVVDVDSAMVELKKVTNETDQAYDKFLSSAADKAVKIGASYSDFITSTADFARLGYSLKEAEGLAEVATVYSVVGDEIDSVDTATGSIISTMKAFKVETSDAMSIVDKFNAVGNNFAISSGGIGDALTRSASSMAAANNTLDETIALITAANTVVQDPDSVGTAFKTISMRIRGAKTEMEEAGLDTEGMAESVSTLREEILALSGVDIMLNDTEFKSTYQIMDELSGKWKELTDIQQASITELIAGKRQGNIVSSLMENFDIARNALQTSLSSEGSAMEEHAKWMDSIQAKQQQFQAQYQTLANTILNSDLIKGAYDAGTGILGFLTDVIDAFGVLGTVAGGAGIAKIFSGINSAGNLGKVKKELESLKEVGSGILGKDSSIDFSQLGKNLQGMKIDDAAKALKALNIEGDSAISVLTGMGADTLEVQAAMAKLKKEGFSLKNVFTGIKESGSKALSGLLGMLKSPALWVGVAAAAAAIAAGVAIYKNSFAGLSATAEKSKETFEETNSELQTMQSEYQTTAERIKELQALQAQGKLTTVEEQELAKLQSANNLLEAQINLKKQQLELERKQAAKDANKALTKDSILYFNGMTGSYTGEATPTYAKRDIIDDYQAQLDQVEELRSQSKKLQEEIDAIEGSKDFDASDRTYRNKVKRLESLQGQIDNLDLQIANDGVTLLGLYNSLLDGNGEVYQDYVETANRIAGVIDINGATKDVDDTAQAIKDSFKRNIDSMELGDYDKLQIGNWFDSLSESDQELVYKISCDTDGAITSVEQWQSALSTAKEAASKELGAIQQQVKDSSDKSKKLVENFSSVVEVLNAQSTGKSLSFEEYNSEALAEYTEALEYTNGTLQLNSEIVQQIIEQKAEEQISINDTNKALAQSKYLENAREIQKLRDVLKTNSAYREANEQAIRSEIDRLLAENEALAASCTQFDLMTASIREATSAYQHWINSQNAAQSGDMFDGALNAINHINDTLNNTESDLYGRVGRSDYKAAVDFIVPESVDHDDANAVNSYISSISDMFLYDKSGKQTGLNIANFCQKAVDAGLMVLNEAGDAYEIAGGKTMEDFANGLNLAMPLVQAMFGEMEEFGAKFDWSDEAVKTLGDLAVAATESAEALRQVEGCEDLDIRMDVSEVVDGKEAVDILNSTIEEMNGVKAKFGVDSSEAEYANDVIRYCLEQKHQLMAKTVMSVDASQVDGEIGEAISLLQQFVALSSQIEIDAAMGLDTSEAQGQLNGVVAQIQGLSPEMKTNLGLNTSSVATIQSSVAGISPTMMVNAGLNASLVEGYKPSDKEATVVFNKDSRAVDSYNPRNLSRTVTYGLNSSAVDNYNPRNIYRTVYYTYETTNSPPGGSSVNGTAHAGGTARASGDWGTAPGGRTLVGELGREIVVDPHTGRWYTVGDVGAEFVNIPRGAIVFNHLQSDALLKHGYVTTRGMAHADGTAHAGGTAAVTGYVPISAITSNKYHGTTGGYGSAGSSVSGSAINSSATSSTASSEFEEQYKKYNHLLNMNKISLANYIKWLDGAYKNAYNRGQIELDDYREYAEEVYEKLKEQFIDSLDDAEHQIELLSFQTGKEPQIINYYKQMMQSISKEIASAKASGLTETDDYIQELQAKYIAYFEDMADMQEAAEDDAYDMMEELIEYRIDMLKQDLENEKDALSDKIDSLKEFYNEQKEMLQDSRDEEQYIEDQAEKRKARDEIKAELDRIKLDDSAWAQKRRLELQDELADAEKDLTDFEKDHAYDVALDMLDKMYEQQEQSIQSQIEVIEDKLNDPKALYNQALKDIQNNTYALYQEMIAYNNKYGDGNSDTVKDMWEEAYIAFQTYWRVFGEKYKGITLNNATGYVPEELSKPGYASGTRSATAGLHQFDEEGSEYIFASQNGDKYRLFSSGDKVLNAKASDFLYDLATSGGSSIVQRLLAFCANACDGIVGKISGSVRNTETGITRLRDSVVNNRDTSAEINMGNIIVQGNADEKTVSEIRREKRAEMRWILKEFQSMKNSSSTRLRGGV